MRVMHSGDVPGFDNFSINDAPHNNGVNLDRSTLQYHCVFDMHDN